MIKDPLRYREQNDRDAAKRLQRLTYAQSAKLVEGLLLTGLIHELHFTQHGPPMCLRRALHGYRRTAPRDA